jgi:hypothetical protein
MGDISIQFRPNEPAVIKFLKRAYSQDLYEAYPYSNPKIY